MKNRFLKILAVLVLVATVVCSFASCATKASADDASGSWGSLSWSYSKDTKTLSISGEGDMHNAETPAGVNWASVRSSVETVRISNGITSIGDYAFYGMSALKTVEMSPSVTELGKCSFAFCSSIEKINLSSNILKIGESAFEACVKLNDITLPASVTEVGSKAFAFCRELKVVIMAGAPVQIGSYAFKDCSALATVAINDVSAVTFGENVFEGATLMSTDEISGYNANVTVTVQYKDENGADLRDRVTEMKEFGEEYSYLAPTIDGYTVSGDMQRSGNVAGEDIVIVFSYIKNVETEPVVETEVETEPVQTEEESKVGMIIGLVIFGVVIVGICVGAFLLMRSDKKQKKNGTTVRKNNSNGKRK